MVHFFCTGQPGCGKTTLVRRLAQSLRRRGLRVRGFLTEEVRRRGRRCGFDVVALGARGGPRRRPLARKAELLPGGCRMGAFSVDVEGFEQVALPALQEKVDVYIIDEIGRMELMSEAFRAAVSKLLRGKTPIVGALTAPVYGHRVPFVDAIAARRDVEVTRMKPSTRQAATKEMLAKLSALRACSSKPVRKEQRAPGVHS